MPLSIEACGAIIILPPVYLLLLKATNRQRRSSRSPSARKRKRAAAQPRQGNEHAHQIAELAQKFQMAIRQCRHVRRKTHVQRIDVIKRSARVVQSNNVAGTRAAVQNSFDAEFGEIGPALGKVAQERIARSQRKKSEGGAPIGGRIRENAVDDLEACAVAAHGNEIAKTVGVSIMGEHGGFAGRARFAHLQLQASRAQSVERAREPACRSVRRRPPDSQS